MHLNKVFCCGKFHSERPQPEKYFQIFFFSFEPLYRIFFAIFSMLGLVSSGYFYCGCMIYLFLRNHVLLNILRAVRKSGKWITVQRKIFAGCIFREFIIRWISRKENSRIVYAREATPIIKIKPGSTLGMLDKGNALIDF